MCDVVTVWSSVFFLILYCATAGDAERVRRCGNLSVGAHRAGVASCGVALLSYVAKTLFSTR
jgi:hypothetical protein